MTKGWERALVTGASSGIGEAMARQLAAGGTNLVLVARSRSALDELAAELRAVEVEVIAADVTDDGQRASVEARLRDPSSPIDLLVNNAGVGTSGPFVEGDAEADARMIDLNIDALVRLTHVAGAEMVARRRGTIVNVSSLGGFQPTPGYAVYGATKAFVTSFTEALAVELRGSGVSATAVHPGATRTNFQTNAGGSDDKLPGFLWQTADQCAAEALRAAAAGRVVVTTGVPNRLAVALSYPLPRRAKRRVAAIFASRLT